MYATELTDTISDHRSHTRCLHVPEDHLTASPYNTPAIAVASTTLLAHDAVAFSSATFGHIPVRGRRCGLVLWTSVPLP